MTHNRDCECDYCWSIIRTAMKSDGMTDEDYHNNETAKEYRKGYEERCDLVRVVKSVETHKDIMNELRKDENSEKLDVIKMFYRVFKYLNAFENFIHQHGMKELLRQGQQRLVTKQHHRSDAGEPERNSHGNPNQKK